jgi:hypothetical protein
MINQPKNSIELWIIALGIIGISFLIGLFVPESRSASPSIAYQEAMLGMLVAIMRLIGSVLLLVSIPLFLRKSRRNTNKCSKCGAISPSTSDKFCRECGEALLT